MSYGKTKYNSYRKRSFTMSDSRRREYAKEMENMREWFSNSEWSLSNKQDSAYKSLDSYQIRLSNHSADNTYHDIVNGKLIVNIKASKLDFRNIIENDLQSILEKVDRLELENYRFINIVNGKINCFLKGYKTKKEVY
ncbi:MULTISPECIES: hypothetical protein [Streptococcus]|uniref:hypothetical protein n=1 Tax=Streptococcus TaxID=1301 RepID=UPI0012F245BB|nr:hypothetical protein [Streptococcus canis]MDV6021913.1 hypothetical protein [Streptococcus canis]GFE45865.1 hypothetical protein ScFU6_16340 [Streptococcus canis]